MRTRSNNKQSSGKDSTAGAVRGDNENLAEMSRDAVGKLVRRVSNRRSSGTNKRDHHRQSDSVSVPESESKGDGKHVIETRVTWNDLDKQNVIQDPPAMNESEGFHGECSHNSLKNSNEEMDDIDWEDGSTTLLNPVNSNPSGGLRNLVIEFSEGTDSSKRKPTCRATAEEKELAELVHKVHLLCLLGRGRIIDQACDDPLIQASLLSLLPPHVLKMPNDSTLHANDLSPLVHWFHSYFHVRSSGFEKGPFQSALAFAIETREGTIEELAALSVALFRALNITTRFVSILDVVSLKPDADRCESSYQNATKVPGIFNTSTLMVDIVKKEFDYPVNSSLCKEKNKVCETKVLCASKDSCSKSRKKESKNSPVTLKLKDQITDSLPLEAQGNTSEVCAAEKSQGSKRKGDVEFEMQLQMALSATATTASQSSMVTEEPNLNSSSSSISSPFKRIRKSTNEESNSQGFSTAFGARKIGSPLHWAEVYCGGENLTGKWVHVDAVHDIIDREEKVEAAATACKTSLRYVVAFAGNGAKDVTRRYCMKWYKISSRRVNSVWLDAVLAPLRDLESGATGGMIQLKEHLDDATNRPENMTEPRVSVHPILSDWPQKLGSLDAPKESERKIDAKSSETDSFTATRTSLEDMELETRVLTEPLPTNQQAYKGHPLYAMERWLTKTQILHPKGPVLGFCSGHPVYPRSSVQSLKTKERWLREGLQVKAQELPAKVVKQSGKGKKTQFSEEDNCGNVDSKGTIELYGKWQLEPLQLPHAVNGVVPKNERGQVEVWSEKCLPPGTVHLRLPRVFYVAKRLEIDYAPAMVGFEFRNGRSVPVYDGIVVCAECKDAILEAYAEEENRREAEEKRRNEAQAISRWYQLLSSIITRQRLNNRYGNGSSPQMAENLHRESNHPDANAVARRNAEAPGGQEEDIKDPKLDPPTVPLADDHEHVYLAVDQSFDEETSIRTKRCRCGFSVQVEVL